VSGAVPADEAGIRDLLRGSVLPGRVRLSLEREPAFDPSSSAGAERTHTFVHRDPCTQRVLALAQRSVARVWLAGRPQRLGYLSLLRRAPELPLTARLLRAGFAVCESTRREDELPFDLTSILEENARARALLERGLPGLPAYRPLCRLATLILEVGSALRRGRGPPARGLEFRRAGGDEVRALATFLAETQAARPLSWAWSVEDLRVAERKWNLFPGDFHLALRGGQIVGCLALWDQRPFKQTVVRGYAPDLALLRLLASPLSALVGRAPLPPVGQVLPMAFLSHLALRQQDPGLFLALLRAALVTARERRIGYGVLGLAEGHALLPVVRAELRARVLWSRLYLVHPTGVHPTGRDAVGLVPGIPQPEVACL
jgi:hypothetical protein